MENRDRVSKEAAFAAIVAEAGGFYKSVLTVASSFLGGSLLFMHRIAPDPSRLSLVFLSIGWGLLIICVALVIRVRRRNLDSGWQALEGKYDRAKEIDESTRRQSDWAMWLLIIGMAAIMSFGMINVWGSGPVQEDQAMASNPTDPGDKQSYEKRTIPFGSTGSQNSDQNEQKPTTTEPTSAESPDAEPSNQDNGGSSSSDNG